MNNRVICIFLVIMAFLLYGNTIGYNYTLDDPYVITQNKHTQKGLGGIIPILTHNHFHGFSGDTEIELQGGRYRPLSLITYALEYEIFGENPHVSHFVNIGIYGITCFLLFIVLSKYIMLAGFTYKTKWYLSFPFIAAVLFLVHPVHTEVVANIKGRDEMLALLFSFWTLKYTFDYIEHKERKYLKFMSVVFFMALLSKENAATFLLIIPMTLFFINRNKEKDRLIKKDYIYVMAPVVGVFVFYVLIRQMVLGNISHQVSNDLMNNPFLGVSFSEKMATILFTLGFYIKLLFFPHPLTYDYYPYHIEITDWSNLFVIVSLLAYVALFVYSLILFRRKSILSYGILFYLITLSIVSNLFFSVGTFMNERFLFMPSVGFVIVIAYLIVFKFKRVISSDIKKLANLKTSVLLVIIILFSIKTKSRSRVWKDDFTLYTTDVKTSSNSAKGNDLAGIAYTEKARSIENRSKRNNYFEKAIHHFKKAHKIDSNASRPLVHLGNVYYQYNKNIKKTTDCYLAALQVNKNDGLAYRNIMNIINKTEDIDYKIYVLNELVNIKPNSFSAHGNLGMLYGMKNNFEKAIYHFKKTVRIRPDNLKTLQNLGKAYYFNKDYTKALKVFQEIQQKAPHNKGVKNFVDKIKEEMSRDIQ